MSVTPNQNVLKIAPYPKGKPIDDMIKEYDIKNFVNLSSNESFAGISPEVRDAIEASVSKTYAYPDGSTTYARRAIADYYKVNEDMITLGTGSDNLIELICKTFLSPGDESIMADVTFPLYESNTILSNAKPVLVPLVDNTYDLDGIYNAITEKTKIIWLCNPNNPTGTIYYEDKQREFLKKVPKDILVVIDEAYYEYANDKNYPDTLKMLDEFDNIIITRTFSKLFALASLRIGYAIANKEIIEYIDCVRSPYNVCQYAQNAVVATFRNIEFYEKVKEETFNNINYMYAEFDRLGLSYIKTHTNFIMLDVVENAQQLSDKLLKLGVWVKPSCGHYLRVTVSSLENCKVFIKVLESVLGRN